MAVAGPGPKPGSAFDLRIPTPEVGSKGRLIVEQDHFRFEQDPPGTRRVLVGTNLTGMACFPTSAAQAEQWADSLAFRGYNAVRFHHIDWVIRDFGWDIKENADTFIVALKKRGIWVTIDLFSERRDLGPFKGGVLRGDAATRADWLQYAKRLLTQPSGARGCSAWKDEVAIFGLCPLNEDDPRFLGVPSSSYDSAYRWMEGEIRKIGFKGMLWDLNSGVDRQFLPTASRFDAEDFHVYWDHPKDDIFLNTSGVIQHWQFPNRMLPSKPWICTEWGALPYNRLRGETGLFFACQMAQYRASCVLSYALATNESMMGESKAAIDQYGFHSDPIRLATDRIMVLLLRKSGANVQMAWNKIGGAFTFNSTAVRASVTESKGNRKAEFLGSLDGLALKDSKRLLLVQFGDALNSGFKSQLLKDKVVFRATSRGKAPVRELPASWPVELDSDRPLQAWSLDPITGERRTRLECVETDHGRWRLVPKAINTEIVKL